MKICAIFNIAPLYRRAIYSLMDSELDIDFLIGEHSSEGIALLNATSLNGFKGYLKNIYRGSKLVWQRRALRLALLRRYDCYIITGNTGILSNWLVVLAARILGRKVYLWAHGLHGWEQGVTLRKNLIYYRLCTGILLYSEKAKELLVAQGIASDKLTVVYNSLDYKTQLTLREKVADCSFIRNYFGNSDPYISYVGRLTESKKLDILLKALSLTSACNLIILGDGPQRASLEALSQELGLEDRVWFYGECYDEQLTGSVLYQSAASVSPSSVGLMAIHSLMFGTPSITHDNLPWQAPEAEAIIPGKTGDLFHLDDPESLHTAIQHYITLSHTERETMRQACFEVIDTKYNPDVQIQILKRLFTT